MIIQVVGTIIDVETVAINRGIRDLRRLKRTYGGVRWRKRKGVGRIRLHDGTICAVELHWYEAHGVGRKEMKIKRFLSE